MDSLNFDKPFNFASHLFEANRARADKLAYIDDRGTLTYGELEQQARRVAVEELDVATQPSMFPASAMPAEASRL